MTSPHRCAAALLVALLGCEPDPATQVLVHFDAEEGSRGRASGMRIQVFDTDGFVKLDQTLRFGEGDPPAELPVTLPLVPQAQEADRTFAVVAALLEDDEAFSTQRVAGGYADGELVHVYVLFEDACADRPPCPGQETCREGACVDACLSPSPSRCPRDAAPCGECTVRSDAGCVPAEEGIPCTGGTCRGGACCTGCWDGTACQPGTEPAACGIAGSGCFSCGCPEHACVAGACAIPRTARLVTAGGHSTCAIDPGGMLSCWGENTAGVLLTGDFDNRDDPVPLAGGPWELIALGGQHACAIDASSVLHCWGENDEGETGTGEATLEPVVAATAVGAERWKRVTAGANHTCAIREDGSVWCWGLNDRGQLGQGDDVAAAAPEQVGSDTDWTDVRAGDRTTCGLRSDGTVWCWGNNYWGQIGRGDTMHAYVPVRVSGATTYRSLAVGGFHACAIAMGGGLWCWGRDTSGQSAGGSVARVLEPERVGTDADWTAVAAGDLHTCALRADGSLWCWGENGNGQLGQGNSTDLGEPMRVGSDTEWADVVGGARHTCALRTDGTVWCFGRNDLGQLGTRNHSTYRRPRAACLPL